MQHYQDWSNCVFRDPLFLQIAPLVVIVVFLVVGLFAASQLRRINLDKVTYKFLAMVLDSFGITLPWLWGTPQRASSTSSSRSRRHRRKSSSSKSKLVRTRAEQIALQNTSKNPTDGEQRPATAYMSLSSYLVVGEDSKSDVSQYYPGLVNISGTYCFMNSTLQVPIYIYFFLSHSLTTVLLGYGLSFLSTASYWFHSSKSRGTRCPHTRHRRFAGAFQKQVHNSFSSSFLQPTDLLDLDLNTSKSSYHALRPHNMIHALSSLQPPDSTGFRPRTSSSLFNSREHQDAQELFQLVSECIKNEMTAVDRESIRDRGIAGVLDLETSSSSTEGRGKESVKTSNNKSVFDGLTANRRSCVMCGYTEAVMHFGFDNWQLAVPRLAVCKQSCFFNIKLTPFRDVLLVYVDVMQTRRLSRGLHTFGNPQRLHMSQVLHHCDAQKACCRPQGP